MEHLGRVLIMTLLDNMKISYFYSRINSRSNEAFDINSITYFNRMTDGDFGMVNVG